ncbi:MAG TPA: DUF1326 domain-containing protein [Dehalococcoidia bacterium]
MTAHPSWHVRGDYMETCSCDYLCPCLPSNLEADPTRGYCDAALVFHVEEGSYGNVRLDGLNWSLIMHAPEAMAKGNIRVGLILDQRASPEQAEALTAIATGEAGGPMAAIAALVGEVAGRESRPIEYRRDGMTRSVQIPGLLDEALAGVPGANPDEPLAVENSVHPANRRLALARATRSHVHAFGIDWDQTDGRNNGHFAPFDWRG